MFPCHRLCARPRARPGGCTSSQVWAEGSLGCQIGGELLRDSGQALGRARSPGAWTTQCLSKQSVSQHGLAGFVSGLLSCPWGLAWELCRRGVRSPTPRRGNQTVSASPAWLGLGADRSELRLLQAAGGTAACPAPAASGLGSTQDSELHAPTVASLAGFSSS